LKPREVRREQKRARQQREETEGETVDGSFKVEINSKWCKHCGICLAFCPQKVFTWDEKQRVLISYPEKCTGCRLCEYRCPDLAIEVRKAEEESHE